MYPILFRLGQVTFYTHGLMIAIGAVLGGLVIFFLAKRENLPRNFLFDTLVYSLFAGIVGARILYVILYYYQFENWHQMFYIWQGGLVSFGGIFFGFATAWLILKRKNQNIWQWFDFGIIGFLIGWSMGRIGCFLSGDVIGIASSSKIAIWGSFPVALWEAIWSLIVSGLLFYLFYFKKDWLERFNYGFIFFSGLGLYALGRFVIEFWRTDRIFWIFKSSQIGSLILFLLALIIIIFMTRQSFERSKNA